jgi:hypothetical protein
LNSNKTKRKYKESKKELCLYDSESDNDDKQMSESSDPVTQEINVLEFQIEEMNDV